MKKNSFLILIFCLVFSSWQTNAQDGGLLITAIADPNGATILSLR